MNGLQSVLRETDVTAGTDTIRTTWFGSSRVSGIDLMALHGLGVTANRLSAGYLLESLSKHSIDSGSFDFPGHGDSPGESDYATLNERVCQASVMAQTLRPSALLGVSMGGFAAVRVARTIQLNTLILFCPALYPASSMDRPLDSDFVSSLGTGEWFRASPLLSDISSYAGDLLIVGGTEDNVTPPQSFQLLHDAARSARKREIVWLEGCGHAIHDHLRTKVKSQHDLIKRTIASLRPSSTT